MSQARALPRPWPPPDWPRARRQGWFALVAAVVVIHLAAVDQLVAERFGWGSGERPARIEVAFVRELAPAAPPRVAAAAPVPRAAAAAAAPASAALADAPELPPRVADEPPPAVERPAAAPEPPPSVAEAASAAVIAVESAAAASMPVPPVASVDAPTTPAVPAAVAAAPAESAASAPAFAWPPSTRLRFRLEGWYRGRIEGSATVDWLREGRRYQVHLETSLGPLLSRRITSDGELTERGLAPRRFDGEQRVLFRGTRRWTQRFGPERITLADGSEVEALPGAQDEASQFVQLTWLFTTQPQLLQVGRALTVPLALNRRVDRWIYDVVGEELLYLPFGAVPTFHLKPRREAGGGDLTPQIWIAPSLQYLPVRIRLNQNAETYIDLLLDHPPLQAER